MSYELAFWSQLPDVTMPPQEIYEALCGATVPDGLVELPMDRVVAEIHRLFPGASDDPPFAEIPGWGGVVWGAEDESCAFEASWHPVCLIVGAKGLSGEQCNLFIDLMNSVGAFLYDPQVGVRFTGE